MRLLVLPLAVLALLVSPVISEAGVLFEDDLEGADPTCWKFQQQCGKWTVRKNWSGRTNATTISQGGPAHTGSTAIRFEITKDEDIGGGEIQINGVDHLFTRWYDYYASDFDFAFGMKIHRLRAFNGSRNDFDIVSQARAFGTPFAENLVGINDMSSIDIAFNGGPVDWGSAGASFSFERKRWYCVETEVKLNDPGKTNGAVRIWVDGNLRVERTGINIRGNLTSSINWIHFGGWYSNSAAGKNPQPDPAVPSIRYIDDVVVSTERIGCLPDVADKTPPTAPKGLRVNGQ